MRKLGLLVLFIVSGLVQAQDVDDLCLIQVQANLPTLQLWLNLPADTVIQPEQFNVSVGSHSAKPLSIESFQKTNEGVGYVFLVDISKSLKNSQLLQIKAALQRWLLGMGEHDRASLITFGSQVTQRVEFTADRFKLEKAIDGLVASDMETSLYHGLLESISLGRSQYAGLPARRAIVVLSDGIDDSVAGFTAEEVFKQTREYRVPIYSIGFSAPPLNERKREGLKMLGMLSRQSGGYFVQANQERLDEAYAEQQHFISQAFRLTVECKECVADGQLQHISLTWSDSQRTLNDGLELRLLPNAPTNQPLAPILKTDQPWSVLLFIVGFLAFIVGLILVYRQRLAQPVTDALDEVAPPSPPIQPPVAKSPVGQRVKLTVVVGVQKGKQYQIKVAEKAILGRAGSCDLSLSDDVEVSTQHALLQFVNGKLTVRDLHSTNGTQVNGVPINNDYPLRSGDLLLLGRTELRIEF